MIARTDAQHGLWKAPAGQEARLAGVTGLTRSLDRTALEALNPQTSEVRRAKLIRSMLDYCKLDTLAMIRVAHKLAGKAPGTKG